MSLLLEVLRAVLNEESNISLVTALEKYRDTQSGEDVGNVTRKIEKLESKIPKDQYDYLCVLFKKAKEYTDLAKNYTDLAKNYTAYAKDYTDKANHFTNLAKEFTGQAKNYTDKAKYYTAKAKYYTAEAKYYTAEAKEYTAEAKLSTDETKLRFEEAIKLVKAVYYWNNL